MAITDNERTRDNAQLMRDALETHQASIETGQPGIVVSYNPAAQTVNVQPKIRRSVVAPDGTVSYQQLPIIPDVPVHFPEGGGVVLTFPVKPGDECWLAHGSRDIGSAYNASDIQNPNDARMHDLSDCIAHVGTRSKQRQLSGLSSNTAQLRSADGATYIEVDPTGVVNIIAPNDVHITGNLIVSKDVKAGAAGISLLKHIHGDPQGGSVTEPTGNGP